MVTVVMIASVMQPVRIPLAFIKLIPALFKRHIACRCYPFLALFAF